MLGARLKNFDAFSPARRSPGREFSRCAIGSIFVAATVAVVHIATPITRGWWLVAYLILVGGLSQLLLGPGLSTITERAGARQASKQATRVQLVLWNVGAVLVAVADLASAPTGVLLGSVLLLGALGAFALSLRRAEQTAQRPIPAVWTGGYVVLIAFLIGSVFVGAALAGAL